jgi:hypothetical protein
MLSKKGEFMGEKTSNIILALISLIVLGFVLSIIFGNSSFAEDFVCKGSVYFADQSKGVLSPICKTRAVESDVKEKKEVMSVVAENMRRCWNLWGEGDWNGEGVNIWYGEDLKCFKCERLTFTDYEGDAITVDEMKDFLKDPNNKVKGSKKTFWNYFEGSIVFGFEDSSYERNLIRNDEEYAIVFIESVGTNNFVRYGLGYYTGTIGYVLLSDVYSFISELWVTDFPERDAIMFSKYNDLPFCGGFIDE